MQSQLKPELVTELYHRAPSGTIGQIGVTFLIVYLLYSDVSISVLLAWAAIMLLVLFIRVAAIVIYHQKIKNKDHDIDFDKWALFYQISVLLLSIGWGLVTYLFAEQVTLIDLQFLMAGIIYSFAGIAVTSLGAVLRVYISYSIPMILMVSCHIFITDRAYNNELAALGVMGLILLLIAALQYNQKMQDLTERSPKFQRG